MPVRKRYRWRHKPVEKMTHLGQFRWYKKMYEMVDRWRIEDFNEFQQERKRWQAKVIQATIDENPALAVMQAQLRDIEAGQMTIREENSILSRKLEAAYAEIRRLRTRLGDPRDYDDAAQTWPQ
jgi:hypothetical protein